MGLQEVKNSILESANRQAKEIIEQANKDAAQIEQQTKQQLAEFEQKYAYELSEAGKNLEKIKLAAVNSEGNHIVLKKKKEIIDKAFDLALKQAIAQAQKNSYVKKLLEKAKKELEIKYVYCNKQDIRSINGFNYDFNCTATEITAGIIVENADKSIRLDYSFETVFDTLNGKILQDVAKKLFK